MKLPLHSPFRLKWPLALLGWLALGSAAAFADDTEKFEAADVDHSGFLTLEEFTNSTNGKPPAENILRKFNRADTSNDDLVSLEEYLAFKADSDEPADETEKNTARFNEADGNNDDLLDEEEFATTVPGKRPLIKVREQFLRADADDSGFVSLEEWLAYKADTNEEDDEQFSKFDLADRDGNDELTLEEFATVYPPKVPWKTIMNKFNGKDANDDDVLTRDEWNPGDDDDA